MYTLLRGSGVILRKICFGDYGSGVFVIAVLRVAQKLELAKTSTSEGQILQYLLRKIAHWSQWEFSLINKHYKVRH